MNRLLDPSANQFVLSRRYSESSIDRFHVITFKASSTVTGRVSRVKMIRKVQAETLLDRYEAVRNLLLHAYAIVTDHFVSDNKTGIKYTHLWKLLKSSDKFMIRLKEDKQKKGNYRLVFKETLRAQSKCSYISQAMTMYKCFQLSRIAGLSRPILYNLSLFTTYVNSHDRIQLHVLQVPNDSISKTHSHLFGLQIPSLDMMG